MSLFVFANNAQSSLAGSISNTSTVLAVQAGAGALFPNPAPGQQFEVTLTDAATGLLREVMYCTNRIGDTFTVVRAQEGTTALNWSANDPIAELVTKGQMEAFVQQGQSQSQSYNYGVDTGSVNAYTVALAPAVTVAPTVAMPVRVRIKAGNTNTGASTLDSGWGPTAVVRRDGSTCIGLEITGAEVNEFFWDPIAGTFTIMHMAPATAAAVAAGTDSESSITPSQLASASFAAPGTIITTAALTAPTGWLICNGAPVSRATYSVLLSTITSASTVSVSIAAPGVVTYSGSHNLVTGDIVSLETTGSLPSPLTTGTNYYAIVTDGTHIELAATMANALAGTAINTTGSQSGVQTCRHNPFGCGDGSTTFNVPDARGRILAGWDAMGGSAANRLGNNASVGCFSTAAMGNTAGEQAHTQTVPELVAHNHQQQAANSAVGGGGAVVGLGNSPSGSFTTDTGGGLPFNVTQPTLLVNVIIKT